MDDTRVLDGRSVIHPFEHFYRRRQRFLDVIIIVAVVVVVIAITVVMSFLLFLLLLSPSFTETQALNVDSTVAIGILEKGTRNGNAL